MHHLQLSGRHQGLEGLHVHRQRGGDARPVHGALVQLAPGLEPRRRHASGAVAGPKSGTEGLCKAWQIARQCCVSSAALA